MFIKQLSVFIENRKGRMEKIAAALSESGINIITLSLADTSDYGLLRLIVSNPPAARDALRARGFSATLTDVMAVRMRNRPGQLHHVLRVIASADLNVRYMYLLDSGAEYGSVIVKVTDEEKALEAIKAGGLELFSESEIYSIVRE